MLPTGLLRKSHSGGQWLLAEGQLQALFKLAISRQVLPSPLTEHRQLYVMDALLCRALCSDYGALMSSEGRDEDFTATKINLKPSGEGGARALEMVKAVPMQGTLKQIFTLQASSVLRLVLPYTFWHMQLCCSPALVSRMPGISSAEPQ